MVCLASIIYVFTHSYFGKKKLKNTPELERKENYEKELEKIGNYYTQSKNAIYLHILLLLVNGAVWFFIHQRKIKGFKNSSKLFL